MSGFMEGIYRGTLDDGAFNIFHERRDRERVNALAERYRALLKRFPSVEIEQAGRISEEMMVAFRELGLFGISIPEEYGGLGFDLTEYLRMVEDVTRHDMSSAIVFMAHLSIGVRGIELFGTEEQKRKYLSRQHQAN